MPPSEPAGSARRASPQWPPNDYPRQELPERILQFGTGMLLRALVDATVDALNRAGSFGGRIVVAQSTPFGSAVSLQRQNGLFTLVERGVEDGKAVDRCRLIGSISRALVVERDWVDLCRLVNSPDLRLIVSNVTEAGFALGSGEGFSSSYPARLTALLHERFRGLGDQAATLWILPTELVDENGPRLSAMVQTAVLRYADAEPFRRWLGQRVRFCSSLVDRITTGAPAAGEREALEAAWGYRDELITVTEPYHLWAIECDPAGLREVFPADLAGPGVVLTPSISYLRHRKLRLLNGAHTALAPLAILAGVATVRAAAEHPDLGWFLERLLFDELVPGSELPADDARAFARAALDRFRNPWLRQEWQVIATNQTIKLRTRVVPTIVSLALRDGRPPACLALSLAASLRYLCPMAGQESGRGTGWWAGGNYPITDSELSAMEEKWSQARGLDPAPARTGFKPLAQARLVRAALADPALWGSDLETLPGLGSEVLRALGSLERDGVSGAIEALRHRGPVGG